MNSTTANRWTNLQSSPLPETVETESVNFASGGVQLAGTIYRPRAATSPLPAVIVTGAWTTVQEQMAGTYARELASRGFVALAFDFTGWGSSAGQPRYVEDPAVKTADIHAAVDFMAQRSDVQTERIAGLGICASSGYMAHAVATNARLCKLALVAPWLHDPALAREIYGGAEAVAQLLAASEAEESSTSPAVLIAASVSDETSPMYQAPYYTESERGLIPEYDNRFSVLSWKPWLTYDALRSAEQLSRPTLMVGSAGMALPAGAEAFESRTSAPVEKIWFADEVTQFDFYDRADVVHDAADAITTFLGE